MNGRMYIKPRSTDGQKIHTLILGYLLKNNEISLELLEKELRIIFKRSPWAFKEVSANGYSHLHDIFHILHEDHKINNPKVLKIYQLFMDIIKENRDILHALLVSRNKDGNYIWDFVLMGQDPVHMHAFLPMLMQAHQDGVLSLNEYASIFLSFCARQDRYVSTFSRLHFAPMDILKLYGEELDRLLQMDAIDRIFYINSITQVEQYFPSDHQASFDKFKWFVDRATGDVLSEKDYETLLLHPRRNVLRSLAIKPSAHVEYFVERTKAKLGDKAPSVLLTMLDSLDAKGLTPIEAAKKFDEEKINSFQLYKYLEELKRILQLEQAEIAKKQTESKVELVVVSHVDTPKCEKPKKAKNSSALIAQSLTVPIQVVEESESIAPHESHTAPRRAKPKSSAHKKKKAGHGATQKHRVHNDVSSLDLHGFFKYGAAAVVGFAATALALSLLPRV